MQLAKPVITEVTILPDSNYIVGAVKGKLPLLEYAMTKAGYGRAVEDYTYRLNDSGTVTFTVPRDPDRKDPIFNLGKRVSTVVY
jgi:hypothetical protein